jgi:NAD+ diphosphatase
MTFMPDFKAPSRHDATDLWFVFNKGKLLTRMEDGLHRIPDGADLAAGRLAPVHELYLGALKNHRCYGATLHGENSCPDDFQFTDLRALIGRLAEDLIWIAGRANHLLYWHRIHRFCGNCGHSTEEKPDERALICAQCGLVNYPRLSPAVIVAVTRGDRILLARGKRFKLPFYSVLAGFVEPGEDLEACVEREIKEEVGIAVKDIRYFGSQPWPFPDSLMIGFTAVYESGEITVDDGELRDADWFARDDLPRIPPSLSIARQLIDAFANEQNEVRF